MAPRAEGQIARRAKSHSVYSPQSPSPFAGRHSKARSRSASLNVPEDLIRRRISFDSVLSAPLLDSYPEKTVIEVVPNATPTPVSAAAAAKAAEEALAAQHQAAAVKIQQAVRGHAGRKIAVKAAVAAEAQQQRAAWGAMTKRTGLDEAIDVVAAAIVDAGCGATSRQAQLYIDYATQQMTPVQQVAVAQLSRVTRDPQAFATVVVARLDAADPYPETAAFSQQVKSLKDGVHGMWDRVYNAQYKQQADVKKAQSAATFSAAVEAAPAVEVQPSSVPAPTPAFTGLEDTVRHHYFTRSAQAKGSLSAFFRPFRMNASASLAEFIKDAAIAGPRYAKDALRACFSDDNRGQVDEILNYARQHNHSDVALNRGIAQLERLFNEQQGLQTTAASYAM